MQIQEININQKILITLGLVVLISILSFQNLAFYLLPNTSLFVFLAISPFVFKINSKERKIRYAFISIGFIILYFFLKMQLLFFLSFASGILFIIESNLGKVNTLPIFIILLISPYSSFIFDVFGFPARLLLTDMAASMLSVVFEQTASSGSNIIIHNQSFSVDPECMGLTMVGYAYATTLLFINSLENKYQTKLTIYKVLGILVISTFFIVVVNLFRIIVIVLLQAPPETVTHEVIGLLSFGLYFLFPLFFICKWLIKRNKNEPISAKSTQPPSKKIILPLTLVIVGSLTFFNFNRDNYRNIQQDDKSKRIEIAGFKKAITNENVLKFENENALIYIKPSCHFFGPDHNPTICWKGSGYEFINIKTEKIGAFEIYKAELKKDNEILQTAWWFDNGQEKIISQLEWRWKTALGNEPYRLINVTAISENELNKQINELLLKNLFQKTKNNFLLDNKS
ncbi:MAG: exosortase N [Vicingaceae bacterium]|nr:exosortase N [Vicingaceae bacterium]